jgi:enolase-phosphatase E1
MEQKTSYTNVILDIEGTVCPISFVKDQLFPYFLQELPGYLSKYRFPLDPLNESNDEIEKILTKFDKEIYQSKEKLLGHIKGLVDADIKDPILKQLQGFIWENGYTTGSILAPLFDDAIESMKLWSLLCDGLYIYSSGSVKAQKLLFGNVKVSNSKGEVECAQMNDLITDYFDTVNIGNKTKVESYEKILKTIGITDVEEKKKCLFLSDNPLEVKAAIESGMSSFIVEKPGNYPLTEEDRKNYKVITDFQKLFG